MSLFSCFVSKLYFQELNLKYQINYFKLFRVNVCGAQCVTSLGRPVYDKGATGDDEISAICKVQLTHEQQEEGN